ncbi:MAG: outer membrane beta-barrel protein [Bacteroidota bacterium]|nr:outer membrane beta-barrel protein [Bacteroidota bacterium]MDP3146323.1 outer membrane beta-barrel protein [Bacteroidota bacterium]MDP3556605.1 outer membrane beta-barrel protein [Bacteroidota bacterium]
MRKSYLLFSFILTSFFCLSQTPKKEAPDKTKSLDEFDIKRYKGEPGDRLIIEINRTSWLGAPSDIKPNWRSLGLNFAFMFDKPIGRSSFSFGYGIGIFSHNYHSNANFIYKLDSTNKTATTILQPKTTQYTTNSYNEKILEIPLEIRFRTKTDTKFKFEFGVKGGYVINDFRKMVDGDGKIRVYNTKNINHIRYGVNFRIGVEQICFTACYYVSEVFQKDKGVNGINMFSFGIAIIPY